MNHHLTATTDPPRILQHLHLHLRPKPLANTTPSLWHPPIMVPTCKNTELLEKWRLSNYLLSLTLHNSQKSAHSSLHGILQKKPSLQTENGFYTYWNLAVTNTKQQCMQTAAPSPNITGHELIPEQLQLLPLLKCLAVLLFQCCPVRMPL